MTRKKTPYERVEQKAARGEYSLVEPLDYYIMEKLPEEGTLFAGMFPLGETIANVAINLPKVEGKPFPRDIVAVRMRALKLQGLALPTKGATSTKIFQRTRKASVLLKAWKEKQDGTTATK